MKKMDKRWLFFLVLILVLAMGLPYLSLYQESSKTEDKESTDVQAMSVAVVNEDEGAAFNSEWLTFGDAFVRSLNNNSDHDWFVVSRGVAESGLKKNTYDMMIVIPNDFSQKALSIDSESPEPVVLNYRINVSDDEHIRAEAERTASKILNDFNRRIVDVYFASIIGNLQDAQDNIADVVDKQAEHTSIYNQNVNGPLSNYTDQFGMLKDSTQASRDDIGDFEKLLANTEGRLDKGFEQNKGYLSELDNFSSFQDTNTPDQAMNTPEQDTNNSELQNVNDSLFNDNDLSTTPDIDQSFKQLKRTNDWMNYQFDEGNQSATDVARQTSLLSHRLSDSLDKVVSTNDLVEESLEGLETEVKKETSKFFDGVWEEQEEFLVDLFRSQDQSMREKIGKEIARLPSMNEGQFAGIGLPNSTVKEIQNVITVAGAFNQDSTSNHEDFLPEYLDQLKRHLSETGVTITDTVWIPKNEKEGQEFTLDLPEGYVLTHLGLQYPERSMQDYTNQYKENGKLALEPNEAGEFTLQVSLKLTDRNATIDLFDPIRLGWQLKHHYTEEETDTNKNATNTKNNKEAETKVSSVGMGTSVLNENDMNGAFNLVNVANKEDNDINDDENEENSGNEEENDANDDEDEEDGDNDDTNDDENEEDGDDEDDNANDGEEDGDNDDEDDANEEDADNEDEDADDDPEEEIEKLTVFNNRVNHVVTQPVHKMDNATTGLINKVTKTVSPYQKLYATLDKYLGSEVMQMNTHDLKRIIGNEGFELGQLASDNSLYKFFHNPNVNDMVTNTLVKEIVDIVYNDINDPLVSLQEQINTHQEEINHTKKETDSLVDEVIDTSEKANGLNDDLGETIEQVETWREQSLSQIESEPHEIIMEQNEGKDGGKEEGEDDGEEQIAIMNLNRDFRTLLSDSQSMTNEALGTMHRADNVYRTLDTLDKQADEIEESGLDLVSQADDLSTKMMDKLLEDEEFADNFGEVLDNSRVGDRQNENLYSFLSNPVQSNNEGIISAEKNFMPYFLVFAMFIVVLFTAYVISTLQQRKGEIDPFAIAQSLVDINAPITMLIAGIGALEGIVIGIISSLLLGISDVSMLLWIITVTGLTMGMLLIATYLLRQLNMIGMFILLLVMSMYLFLANAFGQGIVGLEFLNYFSPLQYIERILIRAVQDDANHFIALLMVGGLVIVGVLGNLFVVNKDEKGELEDHDTEEVG